MKKNTFGIFLLTLFLFFLLSGCARNSSDLDIAVFSDVHGKDVSGFIDKLPESIDIIIVPGDISEHFRNDIDDKHEIKSILEGLTETGKDMYLIPGNHDRLNDIKKAINEINSPLIHDMIDNNVLELDDYRFLFIPGYHLRELSADGAYIYDKNDLDNLEDKIDNTKINIIVSHGPPRIGNIDLTLSGENVGDIMLTDFIKKNNINFGIFGHIHEAVGGVNIDDKEIIEKIFSDSLFVNSGSVLEWERNDGKTNSNIVIIRFDGKKASYEIVE